MLELDIVSVPGFVLFSVDLTAGYPIVTSRNFSLICIGKLEIILNLYKMLCYGKPYPFIKPSPSVYEAIVICQSSTCAEAFYSNAKYARISH